jgi:hypothetical protein
MSGFHALLLLLQIELSPQQIKEIEVVLPEFMAPSVLVSRLSAPLFRKPANFRLPGERATLAGKARVRLSTAALDWQPD